MSGACSLIYQTTWLREFRLIFGCSTAATAAVLAIFMGGLGAGGLVLGRRVDGRPRPLRQYAFFELVIAVTAALSPLLLLGVRALYLASGGAAALGVFGGTVVRLLLSAMVIGVPAFFMGGTLAAAGRAVEEQGDHRRRRLAILYGLNTAGAVLGVSLTTFWMLEMVGNRLTVLVAVGLNLLVTLVAFWLDGRATAAGHHVPGDRPGDPGGVSTGQVVPGESSADESFVAAEARPPTGLVIAAAGVVGFVFFLMELVWYRMLAPLFGGTAHGLGLILAVALAGIGIGGLAYALLGDRRCPTMEGFAASCSVEALLLGLPLALGDRLAIAIHQLDALSAFGFAGKVLGWTVATSLVVLPAAVVAGLQFPLLVALLGRGRRALGSQLGAVYAANTVGAMAGSLAGGFGLIPLLSAPGAWRLAVALLALLGLVTAAIAWRHTDRPRRLLGLGLLLGPALLCLLATGPTAVWRHAQLGTGRFDISFVSPNQLEAFSRRERQELVWDADGIESSIALVKGNGLAFIVNGRADGSAILDAGTQVMGGILPALRHPHVERALVIGLGTGSSAGWLGQVPGVAVDVVELEPAMREVAAACHAVNREVLDNPRVELHLADAREFVQTTDRRYDLIVSEPSNPHRAGIATLFSREFYRAAAERLRPRGLFAQWLQAYSIDARTMQTVHATLGSVFGSVEIWQTDDRDLLLLASVEPLVMDVPRLRTRIAEEPYRSALFNAWRVRDLEGVFSHFLGGPALSSWIAGAGRRELCTDDRSVLEFWFARDLTRRGVDLDQLRLDLQADFTRRGLASSGLDWTRVENQSAVMGALDVTTRFSGDPAAQRVRLRAFAAYLGGDLQGAQTAYLQNPFEPTDPGELELVVEVLARAGNDRALPYIERLARWQPVEAEVMTGWLHLAQGEVASASAHLAKAFTLYRNDPWPRVSVMLRALDDLVEIGKRAPEQQPLLVQSLQQPFAAHALENRRQGTLLRLSWMSADPEECVAAYASFGPHVPWEEQSLVERVRCYERAGHPELPTAKAELERFLQESTAPISITLPESLSGAQDAAVPSVQ